MEKQKRKRKHRSYASRYAASLGRKRWAGVSKEERSRIMTELIRKRWRKRKQDGR